jgi:hypothetical protein
MESGPVKPTPIQRPRLLLARPFVDIDAFSSEAIAAASRLACRILKGDYNATQARCENGIDAGRSLAMMGARFEGYVESASARLFAGFGEGNDFGVWSSVRRVVTLAGQATVSIEDDRTDHGVR